MQKILVIVESPAKMKTLKKFLGDNFHLASSVGHIRDLPAKDFGIDIDHDFDPTYVTLPDKKDVIAHLKKEAKKVDCVYLAPDPDREGEAIAWHIASILPKGTSIKRTAFYSITRGAVSEAIKNPREIDLSLVDAQQARRLLDRIVGYKISPILSRRVKRGKGTSAGRVQSVALKLVVDREKEIESFVPIEYWNIFASFLPKDDVVPFDSQLYSIEGKRVEKTVTDPEKTTSIPDQQTAQALLKKLEQSTFKISKVEKKEKIRKPIPPFITSTLQQEASRHYSYAASRTMGIAQSLYEGIDMGSEGQEGLITYMRTDSVQVSQEALQAARAYIKEEFGKDYLPEKPNFFTSKKSAQEAHEAIRPTNLAHPPLLVKPYLSNDEYKLYLLIWRRFIASQMKPAVYDTVSIDILSSKNMIFRTTGSIIKFHGFLAAYEEKIDIGHEMQESKNKILPFIQEDTPLKMEKITPQQSFTKPPPRFTEASLVKELEKSGIGRPSTYATIMNKIQSREYTTKEKMALKPTELGKVIAQMLEDNFPKIMNIEFTANMEDELELIAKSEKNWKDLIRDFWKEFIPTVEKAEKEAVVPKILTDRKCPKCQHPLQKIWSRNKYFYGCSHYPDCDFTAPIEALDFNKEDYAEDFDWEQKCPKCQGPMNLRHGRFGPFLGCKNYPECKGIVNIPKKGEQNLEPEDRPNCPAMDCDGKIMMRRSRFGKIFYSCSNFPDCDVIVNDLDDLAQKYVDHPKTPYKKKKKTKSKSKKKTTKRKKSTRSSPTYDLSKELSDIVGTTNCSRPEVVKKIWEYIKKHNLQDQKNKRIIVPDQKLSKVFGDSEPIDMMQISKRIQKHFVK